MKGKACVFVDGENLRHALIGALEGQTDFKKHDYLPPSAKWEDFFNWIVENCSGGECSRLRTYWYAIETVDFFPFGLNKFHLPADEIKLRSILSSHQPTKQRLNGLDNPSLHQEMEKIKKELQKERQTFLSRFEGWHTVQNGIALKHNAIEFRRSGAISYNLFEKSLGQEKTIDVRLALDTVMLAKIYDVAVIVSGDQDYVPAAQALKDMGKTVVNVAFEKKNGELLPGGARRLNIATDKSLNVSFDLLVKFMGVKILP